MKLKIYRRVILFIILGLLLLVAFFADLAAGSFSVPVSQIFQTLISGFDTHDMTDVVLRDFRLPRAITAVLAGSALALSGLQMQTLFRNPVAGPYILGISSGASLGVALLLLSGNTLIPFSPAGSHSGWAVITAAVLGSVFSMMVMLLFSSRLQSGTALLIIGLMFASAISAVVGMLEYFSSSQALRNYALWTFGSLDGVTRSQLSVMIPVILAAVIVSLATIKPMNLLLLGEQYAISSGLHLRRSRFLLIISSGILAGCITAFCGPIGFIGTAIPHLCRAIFRSANHRVIFPATVLAGGILLLFCDAAAHVASNKSILPVTPVTAVIGAPVVVWILLSRRGASAFS